MGRAEPVRGGLLCVVGARPNFMKMAPQLRAFAQTALPAVLVHTAQHYDAALNDRIFGDLQLPPPDINLGVGSGSHAVQTAEVMPRFEPVVDASVPPCVIVVGDVNSTLTCSLVATNSERFLSAAGSRAAFQRGGMAMPPSGSLPTSRSGWLHTPRTFTLDH